MTPLDAAEIVALAERVEAATGPDRQLDYAIGAVAGSNDVPADMWPFIMAGSNSDLAVPAYTASIDAAMTLVPEGWGAQVKRYSESSGCDAIVWPNDREAHEADAATPALALTAAALRARAALLSDRGEG